MTTLAARTLGLLLFLAPLVSAATTPVVHWSFEGTVESSSGHAGTAQNVTFVPGHRDAGDQAAYFNGTNAKVQYAASSLWTFNHNQSFTLDFYFKTSQQPAVIATMVMTRSPGAPDWMFVLAGDAPAYNRRPGHLSFELWNWNQDRINSSRPLNDGLWHHVVAAYYHANRTAVMYVDGVLQGAMYVPADYTGTTNQLCFGNNIGADQPYAGALDEFHVLSGVPDAVKEIFAFDASLRTLTSTEVEAGYDAWMERLYAIRPIPATTLAEWEVRRRFVRQHTLESLGLSPFPYTQQTRGDLLPLDARLGSASDFGDFTVQGIRIQTWQGIYAFGYLYLPKTGSPPYPAILNPNGHFAYESRDPVVQSRCIGLAKKGFIALSINSVHPEVLSYNITPLSAMVWNMMRALDYLESRPDVDRTRLGCTGASGGGQQTFYLMGVDDRLAAAVPVVLPSYFKEIMSTADGKPWRTGSHHHCNWVTRLLAETDCPEICAVFAPKPCLYISTTQDWTRKWPQEGMPEVQAVYALYGATDEARNLHDTLPHDYMRARREPMYAFFLKEFMGITDATAAVEPDNLPILTPQEMEEMLPPPAPKIPSAADWNAAMTPEFLARRAPVELPSPTDSAQTRVLLEVERARVARFIDVPSSRGFAPQIATASDFLHEGARIRIFHVRTEPEIVAPVVCLTRPAGPEPRRPVILVGPQGKSDLAIREAELWRALVDSGAAVFLPDLRYNGELKTISGWYRPYGTLFGRYEATVAAHDLRQIAAAIAAASGEFRADELVVIGFGHGVVPALIAGALEPAVRACAAAEIGPTYREGRTTPLFDNAIGLGDLPRLAVLVAGRPLYLDGMSDPDLYDGAKEYSRVLGPAAVIASTPDAPGHARLLEWYTGLFQTPLPPGTGKTLSIGDATSVQGASFTLSTYLSGARDETQFGFSATFDAGRLTFLHVSAPDTAVQDWDQVSSTPEGAGTVRIEAAAGSGTPATGEVRLIDLVFTAMADAPLGDTVVQPVSAGFSGGIAGATGVPGIVHILPAPTPTSTPTATPTPSRTPTPTPLPPAGFDLNQNGSVEAGDLLILIENYGTSGPLGDFNGDGRVDEMDVLLFSFHWDLSA